MIGDSLRRGLAAGLVAGFVAGLFALLVGEIPLREAIRLEELADAAAADPAAHGHDPEFEVDRWLQQALLPVASALVGAAFGGLFGLAYAVLRPHLRAADHWTASLRLGAVAWATVALVPALAYPATPPGIGDGDRIGPRSGWFLAAIGLSLLLAYGLWWFARRLRTTGVGRIGRQLLVAAAAVIGYGLLLWLLPTEASTYDPGATDLPAELVWDFRLAAMATQLLLWSTLAAGFGWWWHRVTAPVADPEPSPAGRRTG